MKHPNLEAQFIVEVDASDSMAGAILSQFPGEKLKIGLGQS